MTDDIERRLLESLERLRPVRKSSMMRSLMPQIQSARHRGATLKEIWHAMHEAGLLLSYSNFVTYYHRILRQKSDVSMTPHTSNEISLKQVEANTDSPAEVIIQQTLTVQEKLDEVRKKIGEKDYSKILLEKSRQNRKT